MVIFHSCVCLPEGKWSITNVIIDEIWMGCIIDPNMKGWSWVYGIMEWSSVAHWHELDYLYQKLLGCKATIHGEYVEAANMTWNFNQADATNIPGMVVESRIIGIAGSTTRTTSASCRQSGKKAADFLHHQVDIQSSGTGLQFIGATGD